MKEVKMSIKTKQEILIHIQNVIKKQNFTAKVKFSMSLWQRPVIAGNTQ